MFAAPGSLPTLIMWRDKRQLLHASTPSALQELAAPIPLPEPFEVSCYLEQILQNAIESRVGEGTTATSTDADSARRHSEERQWGFGRHITDCCPTCYKPVKVEEKTTVVGSHGPPSSSVIFQTTSCIQHPSEERLVRQAAPAVCQLEMCSP